MCTMQQLTSSTVSSQSKKASARNAKKHRQLGLEALEDRTCMSCVVSTTNGGHTLNITGDGAVNDVAIEVNDVANTLSVTCDGQVSSYTSSAITKINVDLKGGNDTFWMGLAPGSYNAFTKTASIT